MANNRTLKEQLNTAAKKYSKQEAAGSQLVEDAFVFGAKWWQRNAAKSLKEYERELTQAHEEVIGTVTMAVKIQIHDLARLSSVIDRLYDELDMADSFMRFGQGSMKQNTESIDPRLATLAKLVAQRDAAMTSLGLTYNTTPSKVKEGKRKGMDEHDPMAKMMADAQSALED